MAVTKDDITNQVQDHLGISRRECKEVVEAFFDQIKTSLSACEEVKLQSFGNFSLREKSERPGRNPKTGEPFRIGARFPYW